MDDERVHKYFRSQGQELNAAASAAWPKRQVTKASEDAMEVQYAGFVESLNDLRIVIPDDDIEKALEVDWDFVRDLES